MDQATHNKIVSFIWGIADDVLRDLFRRGKYPDVILPMCVLRRLDAVLEPTKQAVLDARKMLDEAGITDDPASLCSASGQAFYNTSKFTLRDLKSRGNQQQLLADFEDYLNGFSPNVQDILENFKFRNQLQTLSKSDSLGTLIAKFLDPEIDLTPAGIDNHSMGTVFEELVRKFNEENNEEAGEHWTPRDAVRLMTNLVFRPVAKQLRSGSYLLYDDACGTGGILTEGEETLQGIAAELGLQITVHLYGQEINPETYAICKADKVLSGIKAVQTLSRLNRAHPDKRDVFVLDFHNNSDAITQAFSDYYRTTLLSEETDPNKLHDLKRALDDADVYSDSEVDEIVELFLSGAARDKLDPVLDTCVAQYQTHLDEDGQVAFKGKAKAFTRTYDFLGSILPYGNKGWEKLSIFLNLLIPKLPAPEEEDLSKSILEAVDMDSYRAEKKQAMKIAVSDDDAEIDPFSVGGGGRKPEPELDRLSNILKAFNEQFGTQFNDSDRVFRRIKEDIAPQVAADPSYKNALENTPTAARIEHDKALARVMLTLLKDDTQVYKEFVQNEAFRRAVSDFVYSLTAA